MGFASSLTLALAAVAAVAPADAGHATRDPRSHDVRRNLSKRATDAAPHGYTPSTVSCPKDRPKIRTGVHLGPDETGWLPMRRNETMSPMRDFLKRASIPDFDSDAYLDRAKRNASLLPNIGLAISGGGYRAMLTGAGALSSWDSRSPGSLDKGNLGGLLQSATYLSGLSGGGWLVGSLYANNFSTVKDSVDSEVVWQLDDSILKGPEQYSILQYYSDVIDAVRDKHDAGYDTSITDYWGRMLSYQLIDAGNGGPGFTFSSIANDSSFAAGKTPMPFLVADGRIEGEKPTHTNSTLYEFTPWELGSSDPQLEGYVPLRYVGSKFRDGKLPDDEKCVSGFDNAGFVMGTSSTLFNQIVTYLNDKNSNYVPDGVPDFAIDAIRDIFTALGDEDNDIADWTPNPFRGFNADANSGATSDRLTLVDGGEDLQNIPYHPHLHVDRAVDVVFSIDSSADTDHNWPNGASATATYERSLEPVSNGTGFPVIPGKDTFLNLGLNSKPVFFGCDAHNRTIPSPLIVYLPNYPYLYHSNISTFRTSTSNAERDAIIANGWAVATRHNSTMDNKWPVCVSCAILSRSFDRSNATVPKACAECFKTYCWDGALDESKPKPYDPKYLGNPIEVKDNAGPAMLAPLGTALGLAAVLGAALAL